MKKYAFILIQSLIFIHSGNRRFGLSDEVCLPACGVEVRIADVGEVEGSDAGGVDEKGGGGEVREEGGQGLVVAADEVDAIG
jgi:hypothetical protein